MVTSVTSDQSEISVLRQETERTLGNDPRALRVQQNVDEEVSLGSAREPG